jgi:hypothetical protein
VFPIRTRILDDAGKPVRARWTWISPGEARVWKRLPLYLLPPVLLLACIGGFVMLAMNQGPWLLFVTLFGPVAYVLIFAAFTLVLWSVRGVKQHMRRVKVRNLQRGRCPACRYDISQCAADTMGLVRCPECGAGWIHDEDEQGPIVVVVLQPASRA